jgi:SAM-dependent methyltransferase
MKVGLLAHMSCPACRGELEYKALEDYPHEQTELETGSLRCKGCAVEYPILEGIPRMFPGRQTDQRVLKTRQTFGWEWLRYPPASRPEDRDIFLEETQTTAEDWPGKLVLDAGCGMGRYARIALSLGAQVVAFDLSDSLLRLIPEAQKNPNLHIVQGDLLATPFKTGAFDIVYSQGVIHHTADTRGAFDSIAPLVRRGGLLSVWVYGTPGSYSSFSSNPLRTERAWMRAVMPIMWLLVWLRQIFSDTLRVFTTRMPVGLLYMLCYPLTVIGMIPVIKFFTFSVESQFRVRLTENYDWLAPPFQTKHTKEEVGGWFKAAGVEVLRNLPHGVVPKVGLLGRKQ